MNVDPFAPQLLIDYGYFCERLGPLAFGDFIALWHCADAFMRDATEAGYELYEVPDLLITSQNERIEFIRSTVDRIPKNAARLRPRTTRIRRARGTRRDSRRLHV